MMKTTCCKFVAFWLFHVHVWKTTAFSVVKKQAGASSVVLRSMTSESPPAEGSFMAALDMFPPEFDKPVQVIQGGESLRTFKMPPNTERVQYVMCTNGRPMKARVQLWIGPLRSVHTMEVDVQNGKKYPLVATIKFKKAVEPMLKVQTTSSMEFPVEFGFHVPSQARSDELGAITDKIWDNSVKTHIQGGSVSGGIGAVRIFPIDHDVDSIQVVCWTKDSSKKSQKLKMELLQGPNNYKQTFDLQCGSSSQPYHAVFQTPGPGWTLRVYNKKFVEDGLFEIAVVPFKVNGEPAKLPRSILPVTGDHTGIGMKYAAVEKKNWWE